MKAFSSVAKLISVQYTSNWMHHKAVRKHLENLTVDLTFTNLFVFENRETTKLSLTTAEQKINIKYVVNSSLMCRQYQIIVSVKSQLIIESIELNQS